MRTNIATVNYRKEYLRGQVIALSEQFQTADGDDALLIVDQLLVTARQLLEIAA